MRRRMGWLAVVGLAAGMVAPAGTQAQSGAGGSPGEFCVTVSGVETPGSVEDLLAGLQDGSIALDQVAACAARSSWDGVAMRAEEGRSRLYVGCHADGLEVSIDWADYLGSGSPQVALSIDGLEPSTSAWRAPVYGTVAFYPGDAAAFVESLAGKGQLVATMRPYGDVTRTATFGLDAVDGSLKDMVAACGR